MNADNPYRSPNESNSLHVEKSQLIYSVRQAIFHILTIASITAFLVTCVCLVFDPTKFLKSDDPYILGALVAFLVGFYLTALHLTQVVREFRKKRALFYLGATALPAFFCIGYDWLVHMPEGQGILSIIGVSMLFFSLGAIPLGHIRISKPLIIMACFSAAIYGIGYLITCLRM
jgi:hypothetical protein